MGEFFFQTWRAEQDQANAGLTVGRQICQTTQFVKQGQRQAIGLVDQQQHAVGAEVAVGQVIDQRQP